MAMTIGRVTGLRPASPPLRSGDRVTVTGWILAANATELRWVREQILGLANNDDEEVVPVTWDVDTTVDGYYSVRSVSVAPIGIEGGAKARFAVDLDRVPGYSFPRIEVSSAAITRTNGHGLVGEALAITYPNLLNMVTDGATVPPVTIGGSYIRTSADSTTTNIVIQPAVPPAVPFTWGYFQPPANYPVGRCRIEINIGGTWYEWVGTQVPITDQWRISNGIVRLSSGDGATPGSIEVWDPVSLVWQGRDIRHTSSTGTLTVPIGGQGTTDRGPVRVLRNSVEKVVVRCGSNFTYSVARGAMHVEYVQGGVGGIGLDTAHAAASTSITGGLHQTGSDANGNRIVFGAATGSIGRDLANGRLWVTSATTPQALMVGVNLNGAAGAGADSPTFLIGQFIAVAPLEERIVAT
jgi:hypothetical protein